MAHKGDTQTDQGQDEINLSHIGTKDEQTHVYDELNAARPTTKPSVATGYQSTNANTDVRPEFMVTRRMLVLAVVGSILLSTLISVGVGVTVYHVTIVKMEDNDKQNQLITSGTGSSNTTNALALTSDVLTSLKDNLLELGNNLTTASDAWIDELKSLKGNYSKDCSELYAAGTVEDGVYTISPDGRCPFHVYCDMTGGGWTLIQTRIDGSVNFRRTWLEYVQGFGNIDGEHWLGLDKIHRLTADGSQIYFHFEYYDGRIGFVHNKAFSVHGASTAYQMNTDSFGYNGTIVEQFPH